MKKEKTEELFEYSLKKDLSRRAPLAARMRPGNLDEFVGQQEILKDGSVLRRAIKEDTTGSILFWGPPGTGKTTLARIIARESRSHFFPISAVSAGVADLREVIRKAKELRTLHGMKSILFIDEIHRFNKAQQDAVLPFVENGIVTLIGATTENPSFEVNSALLSRCRVYVLKALKEEELELILTRALQDRERGMGSYRVECDSEAWEFLKVMARGDARVALNVLELAVLSASEGEDGKRLISLSHMEETLQHRATLYDREQHFDLISALHKSMRNSDPQATIYWLGRMLEGGEDPLYIARRIVRFASEDIGLADPDALTQAISAYQAVHFIGLPEGELALAQAALYMAGAEKSNALYAGIQKVKQEIRENPHHPVPFSIRNAVTGLMKELGYGKGYMYAHDFPEGIASLDCLPEALRGREYYIPGQRGWERQAADRLNDLKNNLRKRSGE